MADEEPAEPFSVPRVREDWYIACASKELGPEPRAARLLGTSIVLFRGVDGSPQLTSRWGWGPNDQFKGSPGALLDRCAHRNAPLSLGRVRGDQIECRYHGWRFDRQGACRAIPGLIASHEKAGRPVPSFACREEDGFVWVYATPDVDPVRKPFRFPFLREAGYVTVRQSFALDGTIHAVAENALDVPHTAFLHRGLFRGNRAPSEIEVVVRRWDDRVEAEYIGEPRPAGLIGRLLAPSGGVVTHFDRFLLPGIAQVEYRLGEKSHLCVSSALTPVDDFRTKIFSLISFRLPIPGRPFVPLLRAVGLRILKQDAWILRHQAEVLRRFGGEHFVSTELDVLGPHILRLLLDAEAGRRATVQEPSTRTLRMRI